MYIYISKIIYTHIRVNISTDLELASSIFKVKPLSNRSRSRLQPPEGLYSFFVSPKVTVHKHINICIKCIYIYIHLYIHLNIFTYHYYLMTAHTYYEKFEAFPAFLTNIEGDMIGCISYRPVYQK